MNLLKEKPRGVNFKDIAGQKFGRLSVLEFAGFGKRRLAWWTCKCDCGTVLNVQGNNLRTGNTSSCGCARIEEVKGRLTKHGLADTPEYLTWRSMKDRCENSTGTNKHRYVGRGITYCDRWKRFENFFADMGKKPSPHHTLDRINNDGNYEPGNCRWATRTEQNNNRSTNRVIVVNGKSGTVAELSREYGVKSRIVYKRLWLGWTPEDALTKPTK